MKHHYFLCATALVCAFWTVPILRAQDMTRVEEPAGQRERTVLRPQLPFEAEQGVHQIDRLVVKFREGLRVRLVDGVLTGLDGHDLHGVRQVLMGQTIERLFTRDVEELDQEREELQRNLAAFEAPLADLNNYFLVRTRSVEDAERIVNSCLREALVETCYLEHVPVPISTGQMSKVQMWTGQMSSVPMPNDIPPTTPLFESRQTYLNDAPSGFGYWTNQSIVGARFQGNRMAQIEGAWTLGHEDCAHLSAANYIGGPPNTSFQNPTWMYHGTACVGIMAAGRNAYGMRGMGSDCARLFLASIGNGASNMINQVAAALQTGDVMSSSFAWQLSGGTHAPVDFQQAEYDAVRAATARGIHYTFGAGNTNSNLENTSIYGNRYLPTATSSGGHVIGATGSGNLSKAGFSNYGSIIPANGWGSEVATIGYGDLFNPNNDVRQHYTATFGGTSAAGPEVAGVIAAFVGAVKEQNGVVLTPGQVSNLMRTIGTTISGNIGRRPDLTALLATQNLPDGLLVTADGAPGTPFTFQVRGPSGAPFGTFLATARGNTSIGANRPLLLDPATLVYLTGGSVGATGLSNVSVPVPNNASLSGLDLYLQSGLVESGTLKLTSSAAAMIR